MEWSLDTRSHDQGCYKQQQLGLHSKTLITTENSLVPSPQLPSAWERGYTENYSE